jgi:hypothetical protein
MSKRFVALALLLALQSTRSSSAPLGDSGQRALAQAYVAAIRSGDPGRLKALVHPASLACLNAGDRGYFDRLIAAQLAAGAHFGPAYSIARITPVSRQSLAHLETEGLVFPVRPDWRMQIDSDSPGRSMAVQFYAALDRGAWRPVQPCSRRSPGRPGPGTASPL